MNKKKEMNSSYRIAPSQKRKRIFFWLAFAFLVCLYIEGDFLVHGRFEDPYEGVGGIIAFGMGAAIFLRLWLKCKKKGNDHE